MKIINYDEKTETLFVQYNTHAIWQYYPISKNGYERIVKDLPNDIILKYFLRRIPAIVGIYKGDINELS